MSSAARAYEPLTYEQPRRQRGPRVSVNPDRQVSERPAVSSVTIAFAISALLIVAALFAVAHVWLDSASVTLSIDAQNVSTDLSSVRHEGSLLEVEVSTLANPSRIQAQANALGMKSPEDATVIHLTEDVVVTNAAGDLSLAGSAEVLTRNA